MAEERELEQDFSYVIDLVHSLVLENDGEAVERTEDGVVACWAQRGCHGLKGLTDAMELECPHARQDCYSPCPAECKYTACSNPWHRTATDFNLILDETVDRFGAIKKNCYTCEHFLKHGPRVSDQSENSPVVPDAATRDSDDSFTIHLF